MYKLEEITLDVLGDFVADIKTLNGELVDLREMIRRSVMNVIACMVRITKNHKTQQILLFGFEMNYL